MSLLGARAPGSPVPPGALTLYGVPYDATSSFRRGSRLGPEAIRWASESIETYSPVLDRDLEAVPFADAGDIAVEGLSPAAMVRRVRGGIGPGLPCILGGEHTLTLGAVQALTPHHPDLVIVQWDAHADLRDEYRGERIGHATVMRRLLDGGCPVVQLGVRAGTRGAPHRAAPRPALLARGDAAPRPAGPARRPGAVPHDRHRRARPRDRARDGQPGAGRGDVRRAADRARQPRIPSHRRHGPRRGLAAVRPDGPHPDRRRLARPRNDPPVRAAPHRSRVRRRAGGSPRDLRGTAAGRAPAARASTGVPRHGAGQIDTAERRHAERPRDEVGQLEREALALAAAERARNLADLLHEPAKRAVHATRAVARPERRRDPRLKRREVHSPIRRGRAAQRTTMTWASRPTGVLPAIMGVP